MNLCDPWLVAQSPETHEPGCARQARAELID
jgi:hypothetical protein